MPDVAFLTRDQFISLLMVGGVRLGQAPIIPIDHETLLIRLGYVVNLQGQLKMTSTGRMRIRSIEKVPQDNSPPAGGPVGACDAVE